MTLRAPTANWFEAVVPRDAAARAVHALGATGTVQFDARGAESASLDLTGIGERMERFRGLREEMGHAWPEARYPGLTGDVLVEARLDTNLSRLEAWRDAARPVMHALERFERIRGDLEALGAFVAALGGEADLDLRRLARLDEPLGAGLFVLDAEAEAPQVPSDVIARDLAAGERRFLLAVGRAGKVAEAETEMTAAGARPVRLPLWLPPDPGEAERRIRERIAEVDRRLAGLGAELERIHERHRVAVAVGEIERLEWIAEQLSGQAASAHLAWITGWTSERSGQALSDALAAEGIPGLVQIDEPPEDKEVPTLLANPWWARPFELFVRLLGTPRGGESDPTGIVAVAAPLMFGYMFGDVGQGAVLVALGLWLRRRLPVLSLLVPGGIAAMAFGVAFGSVFGIEGVIPALWLHPIAHPLEVLVPPVVFGAALIALGQLLGASAALWSGRLAEWLRADAGFLVFYLAGLGAVLWPPLALAAAAGAVWFVVGETRGAQVENPFVAAGAALGRFAEEALRAVVNTVSFVRVGAFALAHAGLSLAVVTLAEAAGAVWGILVLVLGNAAIIALEGLVVSVQTTRLILFEFFIRFLTGGGRAFAPTVPPSPEAHSQTEGS
jgi:V/A-type H+-transporting ATPase subunit I